MRQLSEIKAFSKPLIAGLTKLGITNLQALLLHLPLRYIDETHITAIPIEIFAFYSFRNTNLRILAKL
jgi:hypothetical protein